MPFLYLQSNKIFLRLSFGRTATGRPDRRSWRGRRSPVRCLPVGSHRSTFSQRLVISISFHDVFRVENNLVNLRRPIRQVHEGRLGRLVQVDGQQAAQFLLLLTDPRLQCGQVFRCNDCCNSGACPHGYPDLRNIIELYNKKCLKNLEVWKIVPIFAASEMTNPVFSAWG